MSENSDKKLQNEITAIISEHLGIEREAISPTSDLMKDLGADSLDTMDLIMALRENYHIKIKDKEIEKLKTVQDIYDFIHLKQK